MSLRIGEIAPDFEAETTKGTIRFHDWIGDQWCMFFSHPKDFTPVCTTELGYLAKIEGEFTKRNCKIIGLSVDPVSDHVRWLGDITDVAGAAVNYPIIGDKDLKVAKLYDMLPADEGDSAQGRTAANNQTVRTIFLIGPDKRIKAMLIYPMSSGRNFDEVVRLLDSCQITAKHKIATPANWTEGGDCIISPAVSDADAKALYPDGWQTLKPYLRVVRQPK
jgi:alkyl hydroperoxide reductase subunit AhpC